MAKLWAVIKREYLERVRTKWFIIATLFGPLFFGTVMILPAVLSVKSMREAKIGSVRIVDVTGTQLGERVLQRLTAATSLQNTTVDSELALDNVTAAQLAAHEDSLTLLVQQDSLTGYLVLDSLTLAGRSARYAGRNAGSVGEGERVEAAVRAALFIHSAEQAGVDSTVAESLTRLRVQLRTERITDKGRGGSGLASAIFGFGIAFLLYMSILLYGQAILRGVLEEKTTRVAEVIVSSVSPDILLAGKVIGVGAVGLTQQMVWLFSGVILWEQRSRIMQMMGAPGLPAMSFPSVEPMVFVALVLFFILGYTFYAALHAAVGAMVSTQEEAQQAAQPVVLMLVAAIIFVQPVLTNPTGQLAVVMSLLPFSAPIIMPLRMSAIQVPAWEIAASLVSILLACVAAIWVSARIYRVGLLMYGKRPSLRELARWIRQS